MTPYGGPPPPYYTANSPPRQTPAAVVIAVVVVIALFVLLVATGAGIFVGHIRSQNKARANAARTPSPSLSAASGTILFSDDFHDQASGWPTGALSSGTTFEYSGGAYVIHAVGNLHHTSAAPYLGAFPRVSISITATQSTDAPPGAGFGVTCVQGAGQQELRYEFVVEVGPIYYIEVRKGPLSPTTRPSILKQGTAASQPGSSPLTVVGDCITASDGKSTRLVMFVNGAKAGEVTDTTPTSAGGWTTEIVTSSRTPTPSTVTVTRFEERDLSSVPGL